MLIIQSRGQGIFNRVYTMLTQFIWYIVIGLFVAVFTDIYPKDILFNLSVLLTLTMVFSFYFVTWLRLLTRGIHYDRKIDLVILIFLAWPAPSNIAIAVTV